MLQRHNLLRIVIVSAILFVAAMVVLSLNKKDQKDCDGVECNYKPKAFDSPLKFQGMPIKATFIDEVSWDIPHQKWGAKEWDEILSNNKGAVDILAFQDGQVDYHELYDYLCVNKKLAEKYGMECWTNIESFDRDMPIRFLPIKWEKLLFKLEAARKAGMENAITFEFSHFMSPNSAYLQAGNLYNRDREHFGIN